MPDHLEHIIALLERTPAHSMNCSAACHPSGPRPTKAAIAGAPEVVRAASLNKLRSLAPSSDDMERCCVHQVLGKVTLANLLNTWVAHDITHLHQITRVMAHQVRGGVGPFSRNLGVMRCSAHGDGPAGPESK